MKTIKLTSLLLIIFTTFQLCGQTMNQPFESTINFDDAMRPCIQLNMDPEPKTLKKAWKEYLKENYDFKLKGIGFLTNKDLLSAEEVNVELISPNAMDFYTKVIEVENGSEMKVFARHGYDIYISKASSPAEYLALNGIVEGFVKSYLPEYYKNQIEETEKRIETLTDKTNEIKDNIADNTSEIENLKKETEELKKEMVTNNDQLKAAESKLIIRKEKLNNVMSLSAK
jgi:hypothetical protein